MTMALPSAFQKRLQQMEETRNQRLSLLQDEKQTQSKKSQILSAKLSNVRCMEQRCLMLERKNAELNYKILAHKSVIERFESKYQNSAQQFRDLRSEVEEIEESEKEKERFYQMKISEMEAFKVQVGRRVLESLRQVEEMRKSVDELKSSLVKIQGNNGYLSNSEIAAAETRKAELLLVRENLEGRLASNYQLYAQLQKQLYHILMSQDRERRKLIQNK